MKVGFVTIRIIGLKVKIFLLTRPTLFSETSDKKNKKNYPFSDKYAQFYLYFDFY